MIVVVHWCLWQHWRVGHVERWKLNGFGRARQPGIDKEECRAWLDPLRCREVVML